MKLLFFDLETTGIKYWRNGVHQISGEIVIDGVTKESFNCNVSKEQIQAYPPMREVYVKFVNMLSKYVDKFDKKDKFFLVGYNNASFDNHFLKAFFVQNGDHYFYSWFWVNSIDVMVLSTQHLMRKRHEMTDFKQETVARALGIQIDSAKLHDASYDIQLTKEIYNRISSLSFMG